MSTVLSKKHFHSPFWGTSAWESNEISATCVLGGRRALLPIICTMHILHTVFINEACLMLWLTSDYYKVLFVGMVNVQNQNSKAWPHLPTLNEKPLTVTVNHYKFSVAQLRWYSYYVLKEQRPLPVFDIKDCSRFPSRFNKAAHNFKCVWPTLVSNSWSILIY